MSGKTPFRNLCSHNVPGSVEEGPGAQGEVWLAFLGQVLLGHELFMEMGHLGCLVAFENRDQDYSGNASIPGGVHQVSIPLVVRPGVVSLRAGRVGAEARGAGNHSLGPGFGCQSSL